jgi:hypothetical protein
MNSEDIRVIKRTYRLCFLLETEPDDLYPRSKLKEEPLSPPLD